MLAVVTLLYYGKWIMDRLTTRCAYAIATAGGACLWLAAAIMSGRTEAWDATSYWTVAYPLTI